MKTNYEPFITQYTDEIINDIRKYLKHHHFDTIAIETLDMCHLIGKIDNLQTRIDKAIDYINDIDEPDLRVIEEYLKGED